MSEYEELCDSMGLNPGSEEDYDRLVDAMVNGTRPRRTKASGWNAGDEQEFLFPTFREASEWSKRNGGKPFRRSADGAFFVPVRSALAQQATNELRSESVATVRAFLEGKALPGSDWLPGTYDGDGLMEGLWLRDFERGKRYFRPRLAVLAPPFARQYERGDFDFAPGSRSFLKSLSPEQLGELLALLEGKLIRAKRWYKTSAIAEAKPGVAIDETLYEEIPVGFNQIRAIVEGRVDDLKRHKLFPKELLFWRAAVDIVQKEYDQRLRELKSEQRTG